MLQIRKALIISSDLEMEILRSVRKRKNVVWKPKGKKRPPGVVEPTCIPIVFNDSCGTLDSKTLISLSIFTFWIAPVVFSGAQTGLSSFSKFNALIEGMLIFRLARFAHSLKSTPLLQFSLFELIAKKWFPQKIAIYLCLALIFLMLSLFLSVVCAIEPSI